MGESGLATWGGWLFGGITLIVTIVLAYIIKPINDRGLRTERQLTAFREDHVNRLSELRKEQEGRLEVLRDDQQQRLDDLRMKQVETETTLRIYVETQTKIQQSLGRIEGHLSQVMGCQASQAGSLSRLESEVGEIRRLHMKGACA
ncbi:MAG: hypothetical protein Q8O14_14455 [bacterium]|nr:hypothetical protein [bacterium]